MERILHLDTHLLDLPTQYLNFGGPITLGISARPHSMKAYNPSVIKLHHMCTICAFAVAFRVDAMHQCDRTSPLYIKNNRGTWFRGTAIAIYDANWKRVGVTWFINAPWTQLTPSVEVATRRWHVLKNVSDFFLPPWGHPVYDLRLFTARGDIFATYNCRGCRFSVSRVKLTFDTIEDEHLIGFRARATHRHTWDENWIQGRNQALFTFQSEFYVQAWISLVARIGTSRRVRFDKSATLVTNHSVNTKLKYSPTAHLVRLGSNWLGLGHVHLKMGGPTHPYKFGYDYRHFFYLLRNHPPFDILNTTNTFCIAPRDRTRCDRVQFISGMQLYNKSVVLTYGSNDCSSYRTSIPLEHIEWHALSEVVANGTI